MTEKWEWITDLTTPSVTDGVPISSLETDEFDDAEENTEQARFLNSGKDFMREEERIGKILGFILALLFWIIVISAWVASTWKESSGQYWKSPSGELIPYSTTDR